MKNSLIFRFLIFFTFLFLVSCNPMKKNVMKDSADDVEEFLIAGSGDAKYLISKEEIYQATSKSDNQGIRQITGYVEYRISSYDMNTGQLVKRIELGDRKSNECQFVGYTKDKLWYKSVDPKLGFHARDPGTLDVIVSQEKITELNPFLKDNLSQPEWNSISKYYGFDRDKNMPVVSDNSGFLYTIDPQTLKAEKTNENLESFKYDNDCLTSSIKLTPNSNVYLKGSPRNFIDYMNKELKDISFLKGEFVESSVERDHFESENDFLKPVYENIKQLELQIDSIRKYIAAEFPENSTTRGNNSGWDKKYAERSIDNLERKISSENEKIKRKSDDDDFSIITKDKSIFVYSQTDVTDQSKVLVTKIKFNNDSTITQLWQTELVNIYVDPEKGMDRSSFNVVFSKGDPDFSTKRALMGEGKLVLMLMLRAVCIDIESGKILWENSL